MSNPITIALFPAQQTTIQLLPPEGATVRLVAQSQDTIALQAVPGGTGGGGSGDMTKAVYDTNSDGIVDVAAVITNQGDAATLNVGTTAGTVAAGNHLHTGVYQLASGTLTEWAAIDPSAGTSGQVLTSNGAGNAPTYQDAAGAGATTELDNLTTTAINADLLPDGSRTLGNPSSEWGGLSLTSGAAAAWDGGGATISYTNGEIVFQFSHGANFGNVVTAVDAQFQNYTVIDYSLGTILGSFCFDGVGSAALRPHTGANNKCLLQAYDLDGAAWVTFGTLTSANTPTFDLSTSVTLGGSTFADLFQGKDAELTAISGLISAANKIPRFTGSGTADLIDFKDEDDMASDSATAAPSQQSVKAYVDAQVGGAGGATVIASGSFAAANDQVFSVAIPDNFSYLVLTFDGLSCATTTRQPLFQVSTDGGATYDTTAGNYEYHNITGTTLAKPTLASLGSTLAVTSAQSHSGCIRIYNYQGGMAPQFEGHVYANGVYYRVFGSYVGSTLNIDGLRMIWNSTGNSDAGTWSLDGIA